MLNKQGFKIVIDQNLQPDKLSIMQKENVFIAHPANTDQMNALKAFVKALKIKFEITNEKPYDSDFVAKIEKGRKDYRNGKGTAMTIEQLNSLWK